MTAVAGVYDSLADFMASLDPVKVLAFHAPNSIQKRVENLLEKQQDVALVPTEKEELEHYMILEHIVRMAKSRARVLLSKKMAA